MSRFVIMDPRDLVPHPLNNHVFGPEVPEEFVDDVKVNGVQTVIEVMPLRETSDGEKFPANKHVIIKGHRRVVAAINAGHEEVPVLVRDPADPKDAELELLRDNLPALRRKLTPEIVARMVKAIEERQVRVVRSRTGRPRSAISEVAKTTGMSERTVRDAVRVGEKIDSLKAEGSHAQAASLVELAQASLRKAAEQVQHDIPALADPEPIVRGKREEVEDAAKERRAALIRAERGMTEVVKALRAAAVADGGVDGHAALNECLMHWGSLSQTIASWMLV